MGEMIEFAANGSTCPGYLARAERQGAPGVVVLQEWWGLNDNIKQICDRFAAAGYTALAPDLYHGVVTREPDEAGKLMMALNVERAEKDVRGAIRHLRVLTGKPVGTVGFCMGGAISLFAAANNPDDVAACVDFYGIHPSIQPNFTALRAPVLGLFAEQDAFVNPEAVNGLSAALTQHGRRHDFTTYPGVDHAFFNDQRPEVFHPRSAEDAWQKTLAFLGAELT